MIFDEQTIQEFRHKVMAKANSLSYSNPDVSTALLIIGGRIEGIGEISRDIIEQSGEDGDQNITEKARSILMKINESMHKNSK